MRIRVKPSRRKHGRIALNLASMIDVIFLLLIYAMVTMVISTPEDRLSPAIQTRSDTASGSMSDLQPQIVEVVVRDGDPAYILGSRVLRDEVSLVQALEPLDKGAGLFIKVTDEPNVGFVIAAFQAGHDAGFEKVTYVVEK